MIESRMKRAAEESEGMGAYDYLIINDDLETCVKETHEIITLAHNRCVSNEALIRQIQEELRVNLEG